MVSARARGIYEEEAKERLSTNGGHSGPVNCPEAKGDSRDKAGAALHVSGKSVDRATTVLQQGSKELQQAVDSGEVSVSRAAQLAKSTPKPQQLEVAKTRPTTNEKTPFDHLQHWWKKADPSAQTRFMLWIDGDCT